MIELTVTEAAVKEFYTDIVRFHNPAAIGLKKGDLIKITAYRHDEKVGNTVAFLRGSDRIEPKIYMDGNVRDRLNVKKDEKYDFEIKRGSFVGWLWIAWNASDPAYRLAGRIALILGLTAIALAVPPLIKEFL